MKQVAVAIVLILSFSYRYMARDTVFVFQI